jgi:mannitol-1-phosphate 5-dehydrogenase
MKQPSNSERIDKAVTSIAQREYMGQKTIVVWGAGKIGRGFVADLFYAAGYHIVLVDTSATLITQLCEAGRYTIVRAESAERRHDVVIEAFTALSTAQTDRIVEAILAADILAVAVFPGEFAQVARQLAPGLARRQAKRPDVPIDIVLCTNLAHAGPQFEALLRGSLPADTQAYMESKVGVVETLVVRIAAEPPAELRRREPLLVWTNGYPELPVDRNAFKGDIPSVSALRLVDDMRAEEIRKLYTYNTFQAALAYLGARRGYVLAVECMADPSVQAEAEGVLDEASRALQAEYGFADDDMARWIKGVVTQTNNPLLGDTVKRLGADPRRKLKREDRLIGPTLLARKHNIEPKHLVSAIAAGLRYDDPDDPGAIHVQELLAALGLPRAVQEVCGLSEAEQDLLEAIVKAYHQLL